jgi:hypothetical protein
MNRLLSRGMQGFDTLQPPEPNNPKMAERSKRNFIV